MNTPSKPFKILSIDGGGIKGLYSSTILQRFEEAFTCQLTDKFDMICGTSTGGLIALAISLGIPCEKVSQLYREKGAKIFPPSSRVSKFLKRLFPAASAKHFRKQLFFWGKYSAAELTKALEELFEDHVIGESRNLLCIPSYTITEGRNYIFKKDYGDKDRDDKRKYIDVALATSAAPTYLPIHEISDRDNQQFIDGGVWANNPAMVGLIEAQNCFVGEGRDYDGIDILSISSLSHTQGKPPGWRKERSFLGWNDDLFNVMMNGQAQFVNYFLETSERLPNSHITYFRVPSSKVSSQQEAYVNLDVTHPDAIRLLQGKGNDMADLMIKREEVKRFFKTDKLYHNGKLQ